MFLLNFLIFLNIEIEKEIILNLAMNIKRIEKLTFLKNFKIKFRKF